MKLTKKEYTDRAEQRKDFIIGIAIFIGLNVILYFSMGAFYVLMGALTENFGTSPGAWSVIIPFVYLLPFLINIGVLVFFLLTRSWIARGFLAAFGTLLAASIVLGILASVVCLILGGGNL